MMDFLRDLKSVSVSNGSSKQSEKESQCPTEKKHKNKKLDYILYFTISSR
jgi:hypothetical protein